MKKILSTVFLLFVVFAFSQEFIFDYSVKINYKSIKPKNNKVDSYVFYYNNSNENSLYNYKNGDLSLFDFVNKKRYFLKELKNNTIQFDKIYDFSNQKDEITINKLQVDKISNNTYLIKTFENEKSKSPNLILNINIEENQYTTPKLYLLDLSSNIHHKILSEFQKSVGKNNFLVKSIEIDYKNGYKSFQEVTDLIIKKTIFKF